MVECELDEICRGQKLIGPVDPIPAVGAHISIQSKRVFIEQRPLRFVDELYVKTAKRYNHDGLPSLDLEGHEIIRPINPLLCLLTFQSEFATGRQALRKEGQRCTDWLHAPKSSEVRVD